MSRHLSLWSLLGVAACSTAPAAVTDGGGDRGAAPDGSRAAVLAPDDFAPEDWVVFQCPACASALPGLRAVRCDGSAEMLLGRPPAAGDITGARLTAAMLAVSVRDGTGWTLWTRRAGAWQTVPLQAPPGGGAPKVVGGPHVEAAFGGRPEPATRIVYARSFDTGTDAVSYFDVATGTGYDFFGQALPQVDDLEIQFTLLGDGRMAAYMFSPSGQPPGNRRQLEITNLGTFDEQTFALDKPDQIAGLRSGDVAVLRDGAVTIYGPDGTVRRALELAGRVDGIAAVDSGALAFSSAGDLYCARGPGDVVRLTDTPSEESLFP